MHVEKLSDISVLEHYAELAREYPAMRPMLCLVERLTDKGYAGSVPACTSHDHLVVTWKGGDLTSVGFDPEHRRFEVEYRTRDSRVIRHYCTIENAESLFDSFVLRLSLT